MKKADLIPTELYEKQKNVKTAHVTAPNLLVSTAETKTTDSLCFLNTAIRKRLEEDATSKFLSIAPTGIVIIIKQFWHRAGHYLT